MFNFKNSNSGKIRVKLLATLLVLTLTFANFALVGSYIGEAIAAGIDLSKQDDSTNNDNVKFELYFDEDKNNEISRDLNANDLVLYASVKVENSGLIEDARLELTNTNFELQENIDEQNLSIGTLKAGEQKTVELPIKIKKYGNTFNLSLLDMMSEITLTGIYKDGDETININTPKYVKVNWTSEAIDLIPDEEPKPIELVQELITNKVYTIGQESKRVIQYKITSGVTNNQYPIKSTTIELQAPKYNEITENDVTTRQMLTSEQIVEGVNWVAPEQVVVAAYSLNATNPNEILNFKEYEEITEENTGFEYNKDAGIVTINVTNKENEITWGKGQDEFIVTYIYPADVVATTIESIVNSQITLHDRVLDKTISDTQTFEPLLVENGFGDIITFETSASDLVYKSNMYVGEETLYATKITTKISCANIAENIKITSGLDKVKTAENEEIDTQTYHKNTYINKQELDYILGEQGTLKIFNSSNLDTPIAEINKQTESTEDGVITIENGTICVNYQNEIGVLLIEITNPANAGLLNIYNQKNIKELISEEMEEETVNAILEVIASAKKLETNTRLFAIQGETEIVKESLTTNTIDLAEPVSEAEFGISKTEFSTTQENDVNFTITLKTDDIKYDLYENPVIEITLPEIVENIEAVKENATVLNNNGLIIENLVVEGNKIILTLSGKQVAYSTTNTQISVNAKITTNKLIPTMSKEIVATITNGKTTVYPDGNEAVIKSQFVNFEAETGILLATSIANYNSENTTITAFEENVTGKLTEKTEAKTATVVGTVINNTKTDLEEIVIFGKVQNTGTSINTALNSEVVVENANLETQVYYTEDTNPTLDSNWTNTANANTTAYRIVCKNVEKATVIKFGYNIVIPENLDTNKETIVNYEVYASNQTYTAPVVKLQTPKEVKLDLELTANVQNSDKVYEGQSIVYNIKVINSGEVDAENVKVNAVLEGLTVTEGQTVLEGLNIKAGEVIEKQIKTVVNKDVTGVSFTAQATTDYLLQEAKGTITNTVAKPEIKLEISKRISTFSEYVEIAQIGSRINYQITVTNTSNEDLNNIQIIDNLPEELKYKELYVYKIKGEESTSLDLTQIENSYNEQTKELKVRIDNLEPGEKALISVYTNVQKVIDSSITNTANVLAEEKYPNTKFSITDTVNVIGAPIITSEVTSNKQGNLNPGDEIEYTIKVRNDGETKEIITIESIIPEELDVQNAYYYYIEGENNQASINFNILDLYDMEIKQNEELTVKIIAKAKRIVSNTNIENQVTITGQYIEQITEKLENTVIGTGEEPGEIPGENPGETPGGTIESTYSISGVAWQDDNKNGARENEEKLLKDIVVKIIDAETNKFVLDEQGGEILQTTNENGIYEFKDLKPGKYILVFEFDQTTYSIATYQKTGIEDSINSDARLVTEENRNIIKTDILEVKDKNISNIDIGLILNPIFDLKLDKYITKVTVQNSRGTEIYEYDKTQLAKVEIPAKVLDGSLVIVEYQIDVTNEGDIPAHVDTIVDYVSPQYEFKSELNTTWYKASDNNLYCIEFANEDLEPGKTISTKLVLTKTMTNNNTGLVNNAAEIYETFNEYAYKDIDSTPANKGEEDDLSEADIIISIKTGGPLLYIGIVIIAMAILSAGIYLINKKVIKNNII